MELRLGLMRSKSCLHGSEPNWLVYRKLGRLPLHYLWWRDSVRFAHQVTCLLDGNVWKDILHDSHSNFQ